MPIYVLCTWRWGAACLGGQITLEVIQKFRSTGLGGFMLRMCSACVRLAVLCNGGG
jgi:hypothetical protein